jgi:hypothetical protein
MIDQNIREISIRIITTMRIFTIRGRWVDYHKNKHSNMNLDVFNQQENTKLVSNAY